MRTDKASVQLNEVLVTLMEQTLGNMGNQYEIEGISFANFTKLLKSSEIAGIVVKVFSKLIPHKDNRFQVVCLNHFTNPVAQIGYTQRERFYLTLIGHLKDIVHNLRQRIARKCAQLFNYGIGVISTKQVRVCTRNQAIKIIFVVLVRKPSDSGLF